MTDAESAIENRIQWLILAVGFTITVVGGITWGIRTGIACLTGAILSWLNFLWLRQGAAALMRLGMAQSSAERVHVPRSVHAKFFGRLVLLLAVAYVILAWLRLPAVAFLCGAAVVVPAILAELGYEIASGQHRWKPL